MDIFSQEIENYITSHIEPEPDFLKKLVRDTNLYTLKPRMLSGHLQGRLLKMFCAMTGAKRVVEIGTFTGYSLACLADGAKTLGGRVDAIEINKELDYIIEEGLQRAGVSEIVKVHYGDALEILPSIAEEYDLVFIDADKRQYPQYYELVLPLVKPGGYILADNVSWYGRTSLHTDAKSSGISSFNQMVESDRRVESHLVDIRDGLYVIRRK